MGFALSVQISVLSWILSTKYGLDIHEIGLVWAAGPLAGANAFEGRIESLYFLGNLSDVTIDVGGLSLRCQASPPQRLPVGQPVGVRIAPAQVVLLRAG